MGSSPIARSIFFIFLLLPSFLFAQVEADLSRPFENGLVVDLPGTTAYFGDIPHEIKIAIDPLPFHTITGSLASQVGWLYPLNQPPIGLHSSSPGILFEGIPYPFSSSNLLNWMPAGNEVEIFNFPAEAWWGPEASAGAVLLQTPKIQEKTSDRLNLWGGDKGLWGLDNRFEENFFALNGNFQKGMSAVENKSDAFDITSEARWVKSDSLSIATGLLAAQWLTNDNWYSTFTNFLFSGPNFQTLEIKPYFQTAKLGSQTAREVGSFLNYHFNLAGLAESHLGLGFSHLDFPDSQVNKGFVQTTNFLDLLGDLTLDLALRLDFSSVESNVFSDLIGIQVNRGDFSFLADYGKGLLESNSQDTQLADIGIRYQPTDEWSATVKYIHEQIGNSPVNGGKAQFQFNHGPAILVMFKKIKILVETEVLQDESGPVFLDSGLRAEFSLFPQNLFWIKGRGLSRQPFFSEVGSDYALGKLFQVYVSVANLDNVLVPWPDPLSSTGRIFRAGIEGKF